jgi:hypothetical protein
MKTTCRVASAITTGAAVTAAIVTIYTPAWSRADACASPASTVDAGQPAAANPCADVLGQEARWLTAITAGDVPTVESILAPNFMHTTSEGQLLSRAQEIASMKPVSYRMNASDQSVEFSGDTAIVRGLNTVADSGKVIAHERFTDVFVNDNGAWLAVSAQESPIKSSTG